MKTKYEFPDIVVEKPEDAPKVEHWVILTFSTVHIPGDERSRTNPGHGYPAEDKNIVIYNAYLSEEKWKDQINHIVRCNSTSFVKTQYAAFKAMPATVTTTVAVTVQIQ